MTLSTTATDALDLPRPKIAYNISDYTKQGIVTAFRLKKVIFNKLGAQDFTKTAVSDPGGFDATIEGETGTTRLTYGGAGHLLGTYRMGDDPKQSVVDSYQRSHDHSNLFLVGSGTFPTVGNPTITLSALARSSFSDIDRSYISTLGLIGPGDGARGRGGRGGGGLGFGFRGLSGLGC